MKKIKEKRMDEITAYEALIGFVAWLSSRTKKVILGKKYNVVEAVKLIEKFCDKNKIRPIDMNHTSISFPEEYEKKDEPV